MLRNDAQVGNHWLKVRLEGKKSNRSGNGGRVVVRYGGKTQAHEVMRQSSYVSANDPRLHFGLGAEKTADVEVRQFRSTFATDRFLVWIRALARLGAGTGLPGLTYLSSIYTLSNTANPPVISANIR